jgi:hypothetical protein
MVASIVIGIVALTLVALTSSTARSAGRRTRTAMYPSGEEVYAPTRERSSYPQAEVPYQPAEQEAPYYPAQQDVRDYPAEQEAPYYPAQQDAPHEPAAPQDVRDHPAERQASAYATAPEDAPRWALALMALSGGGLLLGLLIVMIASIP